MEMKDSEPVEIPPYFPKSLKRTRSYDDVRLVAGEGKEPARVMFVATAVLEEEERDYQRQPYGKALKDPPRYLKGVTGSVLSNMCGASGIKLDECYYTAVIKWLCPRGKRLRPSKDMMNAGLPLLLDEIKRVDPDIIVCMGKPVFDLLSNTKYKLADITGGWFLKDLEGRKRRLYPTECVTKLAIRPDYIHTFKKDVEELSRMMKKIDGVYVQEYPLRYKVVDTKMKLLSLVGKLKAENRNILSVDCEWHGMNHKVGQLRSMQICWAPGEAAYIRFMDDQLNYALDCDYKTAGKILSVHLDKPEVQYVGHHISADLPWMHHVLGLQWENKVLIDTEFSQQCVDESSELGLERLGMAYTDLGRYDLALTVWTKKNGKLVAGGYGLVPDKILIPYACKDVDVVFRSYPHIIRQLKQDYGGRAWEYYRTIMNPFVTNLFTSFCLLGLPVDRKKADLLRELYQYARTELGKEFRTGVAKEADYLLKKRLMKVSVSGGMKVYNQILAKIDKSLDLRDSKKAKQADAALKEAEKIFYQFIPTKEHMEVKALWEHFLKSPKFNANSSDDMRRLLFDVKGFQPVKSTSQREKGMPSIPWTKVMELPPDKQKEYKPSADKQTLEILGNLYSDDTLLRLLEYKAIDTVCKSFLGEPDVDEDTGKVIQEKGLHAYLDQEDNLIGNFSCTETGRPRSWKPNTLNLPKWVNDKINAGMSIVLKKRLEDGSLPKEFAHWAEDPKSIPSVRSLISAPDGWCIVESDYQTAELRGWAYVSGDQQMIDLITKPDKHFAKVKKGVKGLDGEPLKKAVCRLSYPPFIQGDFSKYIMTYTVEEKVLARFTEEDLEKDEEGNLVHTKQDLHWSLAEMVHMKPREVLNEDLDRASAKAGNFKSAYGSSPNSLERAIEADTGVKPEEGTGEKILAALEKRQPRAFEFMEEMQEAPEDPGYIVAASGKVRHFTLHDREKAGDWLYRSQLSSSGREARNYQMQESVAATAARAAQWLWMFKKKFNLRGRPIAVLYDSCVSLCPLEERAIWKKAHELFMYLANGWQYGPRVLRYPVDHGLHKSWSAKMSDEETAEFESVPLSQDQNCLDADAWVSKFIDKYKNNEKLSVRGADWLFKL